jgi:hypothetical protein
VAADSETMSLMRRSSNSAPFLTDSSESAPSYIPERVGEIWSWQGSGL